MTKVLNATLLIVLLIILLSIPHVLQSYYVSKTITSFHCLAQLVSDGIHKKLRQSNGAITSPRELLETTLGDIVQDEQLLLKSKSGAFLDPWGHPIRASLAVDGEKYRLTLHSSGPDGRIDTADDIRQVSTFAIMGDSRATSGSDTGGNGSGSLGGSNP